jgi:hypothetical protein
MMEAMTVSSNVSPPWVDKVSALTASVWSLMDA